jgi:ribonuclease HI
MVNLLQYVGNGQILLIQDGVISFNNIFSDSEEALAEGLKECLNRSILELKLQGFSNYLNNKVDTLYGKSFTNKFKYAKKSSQEFISIMLDSFNNQKTLNDKLVSLISPFHRIEHDDGLVVKVEYLVDLNGVNQDVKESPFKFKTDNFNKPSVSFFTDASVKDSTFMAGYGVSGKEMVVSFRFNEPTQDNNLAELKAIKHAILIAKEMNLPTLEVFTDSNPSINFLSCFNDKRIVKDEFKKIISEIIESLNNFEAYQIAWIPRNKNKFADKMSKADFSA